MDEQELAAVSLTAQNVESAENEDIEALANRLKNEFNWASKVVVLARTEESLAGWLMLMDQGPSTLDANPWFLGGNPIVLPGQGG